MVKKHVTIYDIANELKVSPSTVSRSLSDHHSIGTKTKRKVIDLATEWGYTPQKIKRSSLLGVIVPDLRQPWISAMVSGIEQAASQCRMKVVLSQSDGDAEVEARLAKSLYESGVGGLIVSPAYGSRSSDQLKSITKGNIPIIILDTVIDGSYCGSVVVDHFHAAHVATLHLAEQGCRRIALLVDGNDRVSAARRNGYGEALAQRSEKPHEQVITMSQAPDVEEGYRQAERLFSQLPRPDAFVVANDQVATGVLQYAKVKGIKVPNQLAVVSLSDAALQPTDVPLSCVDNPYVAIGSISVREVLDQGNRNGSYVRTISVKPRLTVRKSSSRLKEASSDEEIESKRLLTRQNQFA